MNEYYEHIIAKEITGIALEQLTKEMTVTEINNPVNKEKVEQTIKAVTDLYWSVLSLVEKRLNPR